MPDPADTTEATAHSGLTALDLPTDAEVAAVVALAESMPDASPAERAETAAAQGLLRDLAGSFPCPAGRHSRGHHRKLVDDASEMLERFDDIAQALGFAPGHGGEDMPELRLRDSRIERCELSYEEARWPIRIEHCSFRNAANFVGVQFHCDATFVGSSFHGDVNFFAATFHGNAFFGGASFRGGVDFRGATICRELSFFRANFRECIELKFATLEPSAVLNFQELRFASSSALGGSLSLACEQMRVPRRLLGYRGRLAGERGGSRAELLAACEQYGELEANFAAQGSPDAAAARDWCHYRYMDLQRQTRRGRWHPARWMNWLFMKWCFGYGIYTKRILLTGLAVMVVFGLFYATGLGLGPDHFAIRYGEMHCIHDLPWWQRLSDSMYFSVVTFATIGYGDWHPLHIAKAVAAFEGLLGIFIMSVFTVSFSRKLLR